jgi:hypothetical protein
MYLLSDKKACPHLNLPSNRLAVSSSPLLEHKRATWKHRKIALQDAYATITLQT